MPASIEARNLGKRFGEVHAVQEVSFEVHPGEIVGLLGPNGAGKTTTLRMLAGLLAPTAGEAFINQHSVQKEPLLARRALGFLTGDMDLYRRLTPVELLAYFGQLYEVPQPELQRRIDELVEAFGIGEFKDKHCEKLSTGQKQRVSIARTLVHDPAVVVLDEPTTGLDIMASEFILQFIRRMAKENGKAVIFSTHHLDEVERLCDRVVIIHKGRLQHHGDIDSALAATHQARLADAFFEMVQF
ncbi:MAG: ABC transporter ATP-binding protein [Saprospiraceae bacterium]|jgi:sodium transport system ATP-binding protein|nr:ABC transporter ATP-binding protein [Saprospiraceae bacterium]